ncbi:hypothetical protein [Actinomadura sp. 9N215]|uniref:hypothetical protein n=1 Tax=Actinomadura sp. 9N215 TaxID=3375150 RepID=UPI00379ADD63
MAEFARRNRWLLLLVAAAVTASAAWHLTGAGPERVDWLPPRATGQDWYPVCEGTALTRAAAYRGDGPHPIVTGADEVCPRYGSEREVLYRSGILPSQYRAVLAPYVEGAAR